MVIILYKEQACCTYTEKWTGTADRVQVHLTHGLVVEQGHPEERHTHNSTWFMLSRQQLANIDSSPLHTQRRAAEVNFCTETLSTLEPFSFINRRLSLCFDFLFHYTMSTWSFLQVEAQDHAYTECKHAHAHTHTHSHWSSCMLKASYVISCVKWSMTKCFSRL